MPVRQYRIRKDDVSVLTDILHRLEDFNENHQTLRGRRVDSTFNQYTQWGNFIGDQLSSDETNLLVDRVDRNTVKYIVFSYATPLAYAFIDHDGTLRWEITECRRSRTANTHHNAVQIAIARLGIAHEQSKRD